MSDGDHEVKVGIVFTFRIKRTTPTLLLYVINGIIRELIEMQLPEGWAMKVHNTFVDGEKIENEYQ